MFEESLIKKVDQRYEETLEYIESLGSSKSVLGLDRIKDFLKLFDNPQEKIKVVHIAGTNGKGSTTMMLSNIYKQAGYNVGSYTSPEIEDFRERIQFNCEFIEKEILCDIVDIIKDKLKFTEYLITHFEFVTVIAFLYFEMKKCDLVFLEVGLGGRLDATNVISKPLISVITKIDYDHMAILGNDLSSIALEKCGIIKSNGNIVLYPIQDKEVMNVVDKKCKELNNKLYIPNISKLEIIDDDIFKMKIKYENRLYDIGLNGKYQIYNTITVICITNILNDLGYVAIYQDIYAGIKNTKFAGRFEIIANNPVIIADGAHNESGIKAFMESVSYIKNVRKIAIISILMDKDIKSMNKLFSKYFDKIIVVPINSPRASDIEHLKQEILEYNENVECIYEYKKAIDISKKYASNDGIIFIFGSLYLISDIRKLIV